jgi:hypothetical protein
MVVSVCLRIPFFNPFYIKKIYDIHKKFIFVEQSMDQIKLYNILRTDLEFSDDRAADFVSALGKTAERELDARIQMLATKSDFHSLDLKIEQYKSDTHKMIFLSGVVQFIAGFAKTNRSVALQIFAVS